MKYCNTLFRSALVIYGLMVAALLGAQNLRISGRVTCSGAPVSKANISEIDNNYRGLSQTFTDESGYFTLAVSGGKTSIRVTADGMRRYTHKIGTQTRWDIDLEKKPESELQELLDGKGRSVETTSLINGHIQSHIVPQYTWMQELNDTLVTISIPIRVASLSEEYPDGRVLSVLDDKGRIMCQALSAVVSYAQEGAPDSYNPYVRVASNNSAQRESSFSNDGTDYFCYPKFVLTTSQVEYLIDNASSIAYIAVDTSRGDNYWMFYPSLKFGQELQKMLNKILK